jgi:hypothetical protein
MPLASIRQSRRWWLSACRRSVRAQCCPARGSRRSVLQHHVEGDAAVRAMSPTLVNRALAVLLTVGPMPPSALGVLTGAALLLPQPPAGRRMAPRLCRRVARPHPQRLGQQAAAMASGVRAVKARAKTTAGGIFAQARAAGMVEPPRGLLRLCAQPAEQTSPPSIQPRPAEQRRGRHRQRLRAGPHTAAVDVVNAASTRPVA